MFDRDDCLIGSYWIEAGVRIKQTEAENTLRIITASQAAQACSVADPCDDLVVFCYGFGPIEHPETRQMIEAEFCVGDFSTHDAAEIPARAADMIRANSDGFDGDGYKWYWSAWSTVKQQTIYSGNV